MTPDITFDPFGAIDSAALTENWKSRWMLLFFPILFSLGLLISLLEGTIGNGRSFQPVQDFRRLFTVGNTSQAMPSFPFLRDVASWIVLMVIVLTITLVHRQWKAMKVCIPSLFENKVLIPKSKDAIAEALKEHPWLHLDRIVGDSEGHEALARLVERLNRFLVRTKAAALAIVSAILIALVMFSEQRNGVFGVLAPGRLSSSQRSAWLTTSYGSWWAGSHHVAGLLLYCLSGCLGVFVVLMQNVVGLVTVYLIMGLEVVEDFTIDWANSDGYYGWKSIADIYRTVVWSLAVHGLALSFLFVVLGARSFGWIVGLLVLWLLVLPLYTIVPWLLFGRIGRKAVADRIKELQKQIEVVQGIGTSTGREVTCIILRREIREIRKYRTVILRPEPFEVPILFGTILLPVALALGQIVFTTHFGGH